MNRFGKTSLGEFRAILIVLGIVLCSIVFPAILKQLSQNSISPPEIKVLDLAPEKTPQSDSLFEIDDTGGKSHFVRSRRWETRSQANASTEGIHDHAASGIRIHCSPFDPNSVTEEALKSMDVPVYAVTNLLRYRNAGGSFRTPSDLQKIYGIDSSVYQQIRACIQIPSDTEVYRKRPLDVNSADVDEWKSLPGIGDVFAARIIKYRDLLGGFYSVQQIAETYGLPDSTFRALVPLLTVSKKNRRLDINAASEELLASHPYISRRQARSIVNFRNHHGKYTHINDVMKNYSLTQAWYARISPYLTCTSEAKDTAARSAQ